MAAILYNLTLSVLCGLIAVALAASRGSDVVACLLIYSCAGQAAFLFLVTVDLWVSERGGDSST